jgi:hypothetical protein
VIQQAKHIVHGQVNWHGLAMLGRMQFFGGVSIDDTMLVEVPEKRSDGGQLSGNGGLAVARVQVSEIAPDLQGSHRVEVNRSKRLGIRCSQLGIAGNESGQLLEIVPVGTQRVL